MTRLHLRTIDNDRFPVEVVVTEKQPYQERTSTWCLAVPPRCSTYKIRFRTVNKTQIIHKERVIFECCGKMATIFDHFLHWLYWVYVQVHTQIRCKLWSFYLEISFLIDIFQRATQKIKKEINAGQCALIASMANVLAQIVVNVPPVILVLPVI